MNPGLVLTGEDPPNCDLPDGGDRESLRVARLDDIQFALDRGEGGAGLD
jgi:hypothetical protein